MYYQKYLKYKQKYANLKKNFINQVGGVKKLLFTFNNNYKTIYEYVVNTPEDNLNIFTNLILYDPVSCEILDKSTSIHDEEYFNSLPPFTILNICTNPSNIKNDIIIKMKYNIPVPSYDGEATPIRRTLSYEDHYSLIRYTGQKLLNTFLCDMEFSQINFYTYDVRYSVYRKILSNYKTEENISDPSITILFDSGNSAKTIISRNLIHKLGLNIEMVKPDPSFIEFCKDIHQEFVNSNSEELHKFLLLKNDLNSQEIYDKSIDFLKWLRKNNEKLFYTFVKKLNLIYSFNANSSERVFLGFEKVSFNFLINGTEENFRNRAGKVVPLSVDAYISDVDIDCILINNKVIKTLEYYKIFFFISDDYKQRSINEYNILTNNAIIASFYKGYNKEKKTDELQELLNLNEEINKFEKKLLTEKIKVEKMSCKTHFYKFDPDKTKFELLNNSGQYIEPNINDNVLFDTGNASHTYIAYKFITANPTINFNPVIVKPLSIFYEFIENLIKDTDDVKLKNILNRWLDKEMSSTQIYAEFIGSTPIEFQNNKIFSNYTISLIFIQYLQLFPCSDASNLSKVKGGIIYTLNLKIGDLSISIKATLFDDIIPIDLSKSIIYNGSRVRINGIQSNPELNNKIGICNEFNEQLGRWTIEFDDGTIEKFKPENIILIPPIQDPILLYQPSMLPMDIIVSSMDINELNKQLYFIGNLKQRYRSEEIKKYLHSVPILITDTQKIEEFKRLMSEEENKRFDVEKYDCINDQFIINEFYEDIIIIAYNKLSKILDNFKLQVGNLMNNEDLNHNSVYTDMLKKYNQKIKRLEILVSEIIVQSVVSEHPQLYDYYKYRIDNLNDKKKIFLTDLKIMVDIANKVRIEYAPTTSEYKINDIYA
jgi:hypothetical protein